MKKLLTILAACVFGFFVCGAKSDRYTPFASPGFPDGAVKGILWFSDASGKIMRADIHGLSLRETIETVAAFSRLKVSVVDCPDVQVSLSITNDEPIAALRRLVRKHDLVLEEEVVGSYKIKNQPKTSEPSP
ncbi:MAG: hypothetical protein KBG39_07995 [Opitutaceae bacterium]|jgi:hypothetical protein|nr:hypothetical protein [Opitutaceae bacterium]